MASSSSSSSRPPRPPTLSSATWTIFNPFRPKVKPEPLSDKQRDRIDYKFNQIFAEMGLAVTVRQDHDLVFPAGQDMSILLRYLNSQQEAFYGRWEALEASLGNTTKARAIHNMRMAAPETNKYALAQVEARVVASKRADEIMYPSGKSTRSICENVKPYAGKHSVAIPAETPSTPFHCILCGVVAYRKCLGCGLVVYCSSAHQQEDWENHRDFCKFTETTSSSRQKKQFKST